MKQQKSIFEVVFAQKHLSNTQKHAICTTLSDWDAYEMCRDKAIAMGKYSVTTRQLFHAETGVMLPFLCMWNSKEEMLKQFKIK